MQNHSIREFRIVLPMTVEEYHIGQLWSVAQASKNETGGGEGVEVQVNEPFSDTLYPPSPKLVANGKEFKTGQYTHKIYHLSSKVPGFVRVLAPKGALEIHEQAWNAYPYCRTIVSNPDYMKENFYIIIESFHAPDKGNTSNVLAMLGHYQEDSCVSVTDCIDKSMNKMAKQTGNVFIIHGLQGRDLSAREVVKIDIANDKVSPKDYRPEWDPCLVGSVKAGRPPLPRDKTGEWMQERRLFMNFHRQVVCWIDEYYGMTLDDIRRLEAEVKEELDLQRREGPVRGTTFSDHDDDDQHSTP